MLFIFSSTNVPAWLESVEDLLERTGRLSKLERCRDFRLDEVDADLDLRCDGIDSLENV